MATNDSGTIKYWIGGLNSDGGFISANDNGTMKYWIGGLPSETYYIPSVTPPTGEKPNLLNLMGIT